MSPFAPSLTWFILFIGILCFISGSLLGFISGSLLVNEKPRVFVLTDIENEPDDAMSMVRFLVYANHYDIEGLAATTSIHQPKRVAPERIRSIVTAYGEVRDNLELHEAGFPTRHMLLQHIFAGLPVYGMDGTGQSSPWDKPIIHRSQSSHIQIA